MRVFFNSGEICEGRSAIIRRAIRHRKRIDPYIKYKFSSPFTGAQECEYLLLSGYPVSWIARWHTMEDIVAAAQAIERREEVAIYEFCEGWGR